MEMPKLVAQLCLEHHNDIEVVAPLLVKMAARDEDLRGRMLTLGAQQMVRHHLAASRRVVMPAQAGQQAKAFAERYTLFGGAMLLADASSEDLAKSARQHDAQSNGHASAAAFERAVGKVLPSGKKVRDVFKDDEGLLKIRDTLRNK